MPIHSLCKLLGHLNLNTTQLYAGIYDETLYEPLKTAMAGLETIAVVDWPGSEIAQPGFEEIWVEEKESVTPVLSPRE